jgi:hypothetical protein
MAGGVSAWGVVKPLVDEAITTTPSPAQGLLMLFCRAALPLSRATLPVLAHLRKGETFAGLAAGLGVGTSTAWRYVTEATALRAARAPKLRPALRAAKASGAALVVLDGTLIPVDRLAADRPFYSGKHRKHGMNLQVIASPGGDLLWVSGALPGSVHDLTAARIWGVLGELAAAGLITLAGKGYIGAGDLMLTPYRERNKPGLSPAACSRRACQRPAEDLAHPAKAPLLPLARRATRQGDSRPSGPRNRRMKKRAH